MRELILILSYVLCAFAPVIVMRRAGNLRSQRSFWFAWIIGLTGSFAGGLAGTMVLARTGVEFGFFAGIVPALIGSWFLTFCFIRLREMPGNW